MYYADMYTLEYLIHKFEEHGRRAEETQKDLVRQWRENNSHEPIPSYLEDDFNLPMALLEICQEIKKMKER